MTETWPNQQLKSKTQMVVSGTPPYGRQLNSQILLVIIIDCIVWWISNLYQGSPHSKNRTTWLLSRLTKGRSEGKSGRLPKIDPNFNVSFPTTACSRTFHKTNVLHNDLKRMQINEFGIKYWSSNPVWVRFQEHGSSFYVNIEGIVWLLVKKILTWKDRQGD